MNEFFWIAVALEIIAVAGCLAHLFKWRGLVLWDEALAFLWIFTINSCFFALLGLARQVLR